MCGFHIQLIVWYYLVVFAVDAEYVYLSPWCQRWDVAVIC